MARLAVSGEAGGGGQSGAGLGDGAERGTTAAETDCSGPAETERMRGDIQRRLSCKITKNHVLICKKAIDRREQIFEGNCQGRPNL